MNGKLRKDQLRARLRRRISRADIAEILQRIPPGEHSEILFPLLAGSDPKVAYQAGWILTHLEPSQGKWLQGKQQELIDLVLACNHPGKLRLLLTLLEKQPAADPIRVDFLNFCFSVVQSRSAPVSIQCLCMKLSYSLCKDIPQLLEELFFLLNNDQQSLSPAVLSVKQRLLKAMRQQRMQALG